MDFSTFAFLDGFQIPLPITLSCACVCSYLIGQLPLGKPKANAPETGTADADRVKRLLDRLDRELEAFREGLVVHEASLNEFKQVMSTDDDKVLSHDQFTEDAEKALRAMQHLADEIPTAFHRIENTTASAVDALKTEFRQLDELRPVESETPAMALTADIPSDHGQGCAQLQGSFLHA